MKNLAAKQAVNMIFDMNSVSNGLRIMKRKHLFKLSSTSIAAALSALLAACGSGGGNGQNQAVSSSPASGTTSQATPVVTPSIVNDQKPALPNETPETRIAKPSTTIQTWTLLEGEQPTPAAAVVQEENKTVSNISETGVRGDVLLAMIEQHKCGTETTRLLGVDGPEFPYEKIDTPPVRFSAILDNAGNYTDDPNDFVPADTFIQRQCRRQFYKPTGNGTYNYIITTRNNYYRIKERPMFGAEWLKRGFNDLTISYTISIRDNEFVIGPSTQVESVEDRGYKISYYEYEHDPSSTKGSHDTPYFKQMPNDLTIKRSGTVSYGTLREWTQRLYGGTGSDDQSGHFARLMLIKGSKENQAKLCSNVEIEYVRRLICTTWNIPADWKWGEQLEYAGGYIIDDRSAYPNEEGFFYWRTNN